MRSALTAIILFCSLLSVSAFADAPGVASLEKPKHFIIFIHGIGGDANSFGAMPQAIVKHMDEREKNVIHKSLVFAYPTADDSADADDFAISLGQYIQQKIGPSIQPQDKISFVGHSQGGLVATIWYFHASLGEMTFYPQYASHVDAMITLGTPFWGSKIASILSSKKMPEYIKKKIKSMTGAGGTQLREMSLGSQTNLNFRKNVLQVHQSEFATMFSHIRPLNIAGLMDLEEALSRRSPIQGALYADYFPHFLDSTRLYESDSIVALSAARFDSIYTQDLRENYKENSFDNDLKSMTTNYSPFLVVKGLHASPAADEIYDLSYLPQKCMQIGDCDHPTYFYILRHLLKRPVPEYAPGVPKDDISAISLTFRVDLDIYSKVTDTTIKIELLTSENPEDTEFILKPSSEWISSYEFIHPTKSYIFEKYFAGYLKYKDKTNPNCFKARWQGVTAWFKISATGYKSKIVKTIVRPTYSTFVELNLEKKMPEMRATPGRRSSGF